MNPVQPNQPPAPSEPTAQHLVIYQYPSGQTDLHLPVDPIVAFALLSAACDAMKNMHMQLRQQHVQQEQSSIKLVGNE
ncbi:MAG: hypothetical protein D4R44_04070 [Actinobacteria bacterium]|nr:MAG: hypothetical protein D4R44_04070 [Actinomycetota bacterium]